MGSRAQTNQNNNVVSVATESSLNSNRNNQIINSEASSTTARTVLSNEINQLNNDLVENNQDEHVPSALERLRAQKTVPFTGFTPSNTYVILGHGGEGREHFRVPKDVIIVTYTHPHYLNKDSKFRYLVNKVICNPDIYKNPLAHMDRITRELGNVAIYKEGDICPDFHYYLLSDHKLTFPYYHIVSNKSGIYNIDTLTCPKGYALNKIHFFTSPITKRKKKMKEIYKAFLETYQGSLYPTVETIQETLENYKDKTIDEYTYDFGRLLNIHQSELLELLPPGVYYNFVCRAGNFTTPMSGYKFFNLNTENVVREIPWSTIPRGPGNVLSDPYALNTIRIPDEAKKRNTLRRAQGKILAGISEAEAIRKRTQRNAYEQKWAKRPAVLERVKAEAETSKSQIPVTDTNLKRYEPKWYQVWKPKTQKRVSNNIKVENWGAPQAPKKPWYKRWGQTTRRRRRI